MDHPLLIDLTLIAAALLYASATAGFAVHLARRGGSLRAAFVARRLMAAGVVMHGIHILHYAFAMNVCPVRSINLGVSFGALITGIVYLVIRKWLKIAGLGILIAPIALVLLLAGRFLTIREVPASIDTTLLPAHILANVLGDGLFLLAAGTSAMYLIQARQLKAKKGASVFGRLPPLSTLDRANHMFLVAGFCLLTVGAVTGTVWVSHLSSDNPVQVIRVLFGYLTWIVFSAVLLLRSTLGWSGKRAAYGTLVGFACALVVLVLYLLKPGVASP